MNNTTDENRFKGFVRTAGTTLVDGDGTPLLLRGVGLGNWLLPEGYMWLFPDELGSPRQIEARVAALVGEEKAAEFWKEFREEFIAEADIKAIAEAGFDHVRLPINSRIIMNDDGSLIEAGFLLIDRLIRWCEQHNLWVLLDLHGAPGGQTGTNIDDSPNQLPELFMESRYRDQTIDLWKAIASRYKDETVVLGYDLLNEPLPNEWQYKYMEELKELYIDLTAAVRSIDANHLLMYEGAHWATNWSLFTEAWDTNSALQFHRYWCAPDRSSIAEYLETRDKLNIPIYMGEGGENNPEWIYTATRLYEQHGIGWNFWPWKKISTATSPVSIREPHGWQRITDPEGSLSSSEAWAVLGQFLTNMRLENCESREPVINALFARAPLTIPAWGFNFGQADPHGGAEPDSFRAGDGQQITAVRTVPGEEPWHQTDGREYRPDERLHVLAEPGQSLLYALEDPRGFSVKVLDSSDNIVQAEHEWSEGSLKIAPVERAAIRSIVIRKVGAGT